MTIRHLTVFAAVAEQGSMSAAAKHLYLSQPTVSQAIRELEAHYNGLLFERLGKKLYLTERGKILLPHDAEPGTVFHPEAWLHPHCGNLPDPIHYPGSAEKNPGP